MNKLDKNNLIGLSLKFKEWRGTNFFSSNSNFNCEFGDKSKGNFVIFLSSGLNKISIKINGNNNIVFIGDNSQLSNLRIVIKNSDLACSIGSNVTSSGNTSIHMGQNCLAGHGSLFVGEDVMIGKDVCIFTSDNHPIYDLSTNLCINNSPKNVVIGSHVWLGHRTIITKAVEIGAGSLIGTSSVVTKNIPGKCSAAGVPATVIKENISWSRNSNSSSVESMYSFI